MMLIGVPKEIKTREFRVGLADVDDSDMAGLCHGMRNRGVSGTATGELSSFVSMMSPI